MGFFSKVVDDLNVSSEDVALMRSQMTALTKQLPLLYILLITNAVTLIFTHIPYTPILLTLVVPGILIPICVQRMFVWRSIKVGELTVTELQKRLRGTIILVSILGAVFTAWSLSLYPYGGAYEQTHVAFFMSITVIGCIFCLMHLRPAAVILTIVVTVPFSVCFLSTGRPVLVAIALNFILVALIMFRILFTYYNDFRSLVYSQEHLAALGNENLRIANLDSLTGLSNRRSFFNDLQRIVENYDVEKRSFTMGLLDLDGFKPINDVYGHIAGDLVLIEVGRRLVEVLGPTVKVARLGGDEYGLVLPSYDDVSMIKHVGNAVCAAISKPIELETTQVQVTGSIGFATFPDMARSREQLMERADYALYHAKEHSRGTAVVFAKVHEDAIRFRSLVEQELRRADFETETYLLFQPIVDSSERGIVAFEALARWKSPVLGIVAPDIFIQAAERIGLINRLSEVLFAKACSALRSWPADVGLSFNLSTHDIASETAMTRITAIMKQSGLAPERIVFEITETALMHDFEQARTALLALKATGARIALDDFGTGYSSLSYVHRLPLDRLKIDRGFMAGLTNDKASRDIVKSIVDLCRNLGIGCIVEGVETAEHVLILRALGCNTMQGFYFSRPVDDMKAQDLLSGPALVGTPSPTIRSAFERIAL